MFERRLSRCLLAMVALSCFLLHGVGAQHDHEEGYVGHPKVSQWELCAQPWTTRGGAFKGADAAKAPFTGLSDGLGTVVRRLYPCPYTAGAEQMGLWIQTCNYPIYDFGAVAKGEKVLTTCASDLVVYGKYNTRSLTEKYVVTTLQFENLATVEYGEDAHAHMRSRELAGDHEHEKTPPASIEYTKLKMTGGTGRYKTPYKYLRQVTVENEVTPHEDHLDWKAKITVFYKTIGYHYTYF